MRFKSDAQRRAVMAKTHGCHSSSHRSGGSASSVVASLDPLERREYMEQIKHGRNSEKALEVVVNSVEGDESQLSPTLKKFAKKKGWLEGY